MNKNKNWNKKKDSDECEKSRESKTSTNYRGKGKGVRNGKGGSYRNHISWHTPTAQALIDAASVPRAWSTGMEHKLTHTYGNYSQSTTPGFLAIELIPNPLQFNDSEDPMNVVARKVTGFIRSFNSGAKNYDPNDLMIRLIAEASFISNTKYIARIHNTCNMYNALNRYMPEALLTAQLVDFENLRMNLANFREAYNTIIRDAASILFVPAGFFIYERWSFLFENYFCDTDSVKDQLYFQYPNGFYQFEVDDTDPEHTIGHCVYTRWKDYIKAGKTLLEWDDLIRALRDQLNAIVDDQDFATMRGDMLKAYGASSWVFTELTATDVAVPVHDPVVLNQFKNARTSLVPKFLESSESDPEAQAQMFDLYYGIYQDPTGYYLYHRTNPSIPEHWRLIINDGSNDHEVLGDSGAVTVADQTLKLLRSDHPADTYDPNPTVINNMEDSRLTNMVYSAELAGHAYDVVETHGSETVVCFKIGRRYRDYGTREWKLELEELLTHNFVFGGDGFTIIDPHNFIHVFDPGNWHNAVADLAAFDYAPPIYAMYGTIEPVRPGELDTWHINLNDSGHVFRWPIMRITNLAYFTAEMCMKMNHCSFQGLFNIMSWSNPKDSKIASK